MKIISDKTHGILDYVTAALFALAPGVLGLTGDGSADLLRSCRYSPHHDGSD